MSDTTRGLELLSRVVIAALMLLIASEPATAAERKDPTAAVVVEAPGDGDAALARQIETLLTTTLDGRGIRRVHFGQEDVTTQQTEIRKQIDDSFARITAGMRSKPFDEGNEILNRAFFQAKQILGRIDPMLLARLYKAFATAQVTLGKKDLGEDYIAASLHLDKDQSPRSFHYFSDMRWVVEAANKRVTGKRHKVTLSAEPSSAHILVDGKDLGRSPVEISLASGPHLVQIQANGYFPQGWLKETEAETRWTFQLRPLPGWKRYTSLRQEGTTLLRLDKAGRKAVSTGGEAPAPSCPTENLNSLGRMVDARHVLLASVESVGDRIAVRGCLAEGETITPFALLLVRDATLLAKIRTGVEDALARGQETAAAVSAKRAPVEKSAQDPLLNRLNAARRSVTARLTGIAARERHHRNIGLGDKNSRFRVVRAPLESLLTDLDEAERVYPTDKIQCSTLVKGAEDRLRRMKDMLLSVDSWDPSGEARTRDLATVKADHAAAKQAVADARGYWKGRRRSLKAREDRKRLDKHSKALQKDLKALNKAMKKAPDPLPLAGRTLQVLIDAKGLRRRVDVAFEPPPPPPPPPIVPEVEPEPVEDPSKLEERSREPEPEPVGAKAPPTVEPEPVEDPSKLEDPGRDPLLELDHDLGLEPVIPDVEPEVDIPEPDVEPEPELESDGTLF